MQQAEVEIRRPNALQWFWYEWGGGLPPELSPWVLKDTTSRTWVLRVMLRSFIYAIVPATLVLTLIPAASIIRIGMAVGGLVIGQLYTLAYSVETTEHRLRKAGFAPGFGELTRRKRVYGDDYDPDN